MLCLNRKAEQVDGQTLPVTQLLSSRAQRSDTQELLCSGLILHSVKAMRSPYSFPRKFPKASKQDLELLQLTELPWGDSLTSLQHPLCSGLPKIL